MSVSILSGSAGGRCDGAGRFAAVDDEFGACHKGGFVAGQVDGEVRDLGGLADPVQRYVAGVEGHAFGHGGLDDAGVHGVDPDTVPSQVQGSAFGQAAHTEFGGGVPGEAFIAAKARDRGDIDDGGGARLGQRGRCGLDAVEDAGEVHIDDPGPLFVRVGVDPAEIHDACIVDQDAQAAKDADRLVDGGVPTRRLGDVQVHVTGAVAEFREQAGAVVIEDVPDDGFRALGQETPRDCRADTAGAAADQGDFAVQPSHGVPL